MKRHLYCIVTLSLLLSAVSVFAVDDNPKESSDTTVKDIYLWEYNVTHTQRSRVDIDTSMDFFYQYESNGSIADYHVDVAEYASPAFSLLFTPILNDALYYSTYSNFIVRADEMPDYTAQRPYSELFYSQGLSSEQTGRLLHTQNINKYCNTGFKLNFFKVIGDYDNQALKAQQVTPWITYYGPRFSTSFKYAYNHIKRGENGGIAADSLLHYENLLRMKFTDAQSDMKYQTIHFDQKWNLGRKAKEDSSSLQLLQYKNAIGLRTDFQSTKRFYTDTYPDTAFYAHVLYDSTSTVDTIQYKVVTSAAFIELQRKIKNINLVANLAVGIDIHDLRYYDYNNTIPEYFFNTQFYEGRFDIDITPSLQVSHQHQFYFAGSDKSEFSVSTVVQQSFEMKKHSIDIEAGIDFCKESAHSMLFDYETNHHSWHNNDIFNAEKKMDVYGLFESSFGDFQAEVHYYSLHDYVAYDDKGDMVQTSGVGDAFTASIQKTTRFWHILMKNGIILQDVSVGIQDYPSWATYHSLAFQGAFFHKLIHVGIGGELLYYPEYSVPTYDGALGTFIPQNQYEYGSFPLVNVFLTLKYKPIKFYVKYTNLYALLAEQNYPIAGYPQSNGSLSFGVSWLFYN